MSNPAIFVDQDQWPVIVTRVEGQPTDDEFVAYLKQLDRVFDRAERYASVVVTAPDAPMTRARHARMQADWIATHEERIRELCAGIVFVLPSPVMRGVLKAILKMQRMPVDYSVFREEEPALQWARERLEAT